MVWGGGPGLTGWELLLLRGYLFPSCLDVSALRSVRSPDSLLLAPLEDSQLSEYCFARWDAAELGLLRSALIARSCGLPGASEIELCRLMCFSSAS